MMRTGILIVCVVCVATVFSEMLGASLLWYRGQLTVDTLKDIRSILKGEGQDDFGMDDESAKTDPTSREVMQERIQAILDLENREAELGIFYKMMDSKKETFIGDQEAFGKQKQDFDLHLTTLNDRFTGEAIAQARLILLALPPANTVQNLMQLDLAEDVILLKGMPEKSIAKILQEFSKSGVIEEQKRGQQIFEAIDRGEPFKKVFGDAEKKLAGDTTSPTIE
jgi:hypothetical protein